MYGETSLRYTTTSPTSRGLLSSAARLHSQMKARSKQRAETAEAKYEADSKVLKSEHTEVIKEKRVNTVAHALESRRTTSHLCRKRLRLVMSQPCLYQDRSI
jgi:hypothetical protein